MDKCDTEIYLPRGARDILDCLEKNGYEAYMVGGCVRDMLIYKMPHNWDICTSARLDEIVEVLRESPCKIVMIAGETVTVMTDGKTYNIAPYQSDGVYIPDLAEDLSRRDFTINAIAYSPKSGMVDLYNARKDIADRRLRCIGCASKRFAEDGIRILRGMRLASIHGFLIEQDTLQTMLENTRILRGVPVEQIGIEFRKIVTGKSFSMIATFCAPILTYIVPEILPCIGFDQKNKWHVYDVWNHTVKALRSCDTDDEIIKLALFFHDIGKPHVCVEDKKGCRHFKGHGAVSAEMTDAILKRMKFDEDTTRKVTELVKHHDDIWEVSKETVDRMLNKIGEQQFRRLIAIRKADVLAQNPEFAVERIEKVNQLEQMLDKIVSEKKSSVQEGRR